MSSDDKNSTPSKKARELQIALRNIESGYLRDKNIRDERIEIAEEVIHRYTHQPQNGLRVKDPPHQKPLHEHPDYDKLKPNQQELDEQIAYRDANIPNPWWKRPGIKDIRTEPRMTWEEAQRFFETSDYIPAHLSAYRGRDKVYLFPPEKTSDVKIPLGKKKKDLGERYTWNTYEESYKRDNVTTKHHHNNPNDKAYQSFGTDILIRDLFRHKGGMKGATEDYEFPEAKLLPSKAQLAQDAETANRALARLHFPIVKFRKHALQMSRYPVKIPEKKEDRSPLEDALAQAKTNGAEEHVKILEELMKRGPLPMTSNSDGSVTVKSENGEKMSIFLEESQVLSIVQDGSDILSMNSSEQLERPHSSIKAEEKNGHNAPISDSLRESVELALKLGAETDPKQDEWLLTIASMTTTKKKEVPVVGIESPVKQIGGKKVIVHDMSSALPSIKELTSLGEGGTGIIDRNVKKAYLTQEQILALDEAECKVMPEGNEADDPVKWKKKQRQLRRQAALKKKREEAGDDTLLEDNNNEFLNDIDKTFGTNKSILVNEANKNRNKLTINDVYACGDEYCYEGQTALSHREDMLENSIPSSRQQIKIKFRRHRKALGLDKLHISSKRDVVMESRETARNRRIGKSAAAAMRRSLREVSKQIREMKQKEDEMIYLTQREMARNVD